MSDTVYPGSLDSFTNPIASDGLSSPSHSRQHRQANDAVEAIEAKVGVNGSSVKTSNDYKISRLEDGVFNVLSYGAIGNDTTDDTTSIQAAVDACAAYGGGTVFFPAGTFKLTDQITVPATVNIQGLGRSTTIIHQSVINKRAFSLAGGVANIDNGLIMSGFTVTGTDTGSADGIFLEASALWNIWLHDIVAQNFGGSGVHIKGSVVSRFSDVIGYSNGVNGIWIDGTDSVVTSCTLTSCFGNSNAAVGIRLDKAVYVSLSSCAADSNNIGYYFFDCLSLSALSCGTEGSTTVSYKVEGELAFSTKSINLLGCYSFDTHGIGFLITGYALGVQLVGCFDNQPHSGATYSLQIDANAGAALIGNTWGNPTNINGAAKYVELANTNGDSALNNVNILALKDTNGKKVLVPQATANAVNFINIINAATGNAPFIGADGTDTNIPLYITSKGTGDIRFAKSNGDVLFNIGGTQSYNYFYITPSATGLSPVFGVLGGDTNVSLYIEPKGTGDVRFAKTDGSLMSNFTAESTSPVNHPSFLATATGHAIEIDAAGTDTDIGIKLVPKGAGTVTSSTGLTLSTGSLIKATSSAPANAGATGTTGSIEWDSGFIYVCTATNTWKRVAIATW